MVSNRDDFSKSTKRALAERAGFRCNFQPCGAITIGPSDETPESSASVGVASHITAASPGGARYDPLMNAEERSSIKNGIWMCQTHAKLIDSDEARFSTTLLTKWKLEAEASAQMHIGVQITPAGSLAEDTSSEFLDRLSWEGKLNQLVSYRLRDSINNIRYPIAMFVLKYASNSEGYQLCQYLSSTDVFQPNDEDIFKLLNTVCRPELRAQTSGTLVPQNIRWFDFISNGIVTSIQLSEKALSIYGGRADIKLVVCLEELYRTSGDMLSILQSIESNQGADLYSSVGRSYFKILLTSMLKSAAIETSYVKNQQEEAKKKK